MVLALIAGCSPYPSPLCEPCLPGGCTTGYRCAAASDARAVCVPLQGSVAACGLTAPIGGGPQHDAGASDATVVERCPPPLGNGLTWIFSDTATLCFTRTEVTVREFASCVTSTCTPALNYQPYAGPFRECNFGSGFDDHPMNCVKQAAAVDYCAFVNGRLPTEAEWVAEASAGGTRTYPWGDEAPSCSRAVMDDGAGPGCGEGPTQARCTRPLGNSASGLCDMAGNVWERTVTLERSEPVVCGGSADSAAPSVRANARSTAPAGGVYGGVGFRCVRAPL